MATATVLSNITSEFGITLSLTTFQNELGFDYNQAQWLSSIYYLATCSLAIPSSKLCQKYGIILIHIICLSLMIPERLISYWLYDNYTVLLILRLIDGILTTGTIASRNCSLVMYPKPEEKSSYMQASIITSQIFGALIPFLYGYLISWNFKVQFLISAACSFIALISLLQYEDIIINKQKVIFDYFGTIAITLAASSLCLLFTLISNYKWIGVGVFAVICILSSIGLLYAEHKAKDPIIAPFVMHNPVSDLFIVNTCVYIVTVALTWIVPQILNDPKQSGYYMMGLYIAAAISSLFIPVLGKRIVTKISMTVSYGLSCIVFILMIIFVKQKTVYSCLFVVSGFFVQFVAFIVFPKIMMSVPPYLSSYVSTLPTTSRTIASGLSLCIVSCVTKLVPDFYTAQQINTVIILAIIIFQMFIIWFRIGTTKSEKGLIGFKESDVRELKIDNKYMNLDKESLTVEKDHNQQK